MTWEYLLIFPMAHGAMKTQELITIAFNTTVYQRFAYGNTETASVSLTKMFL